MVTARDYGHGQRRSSGSLSRSDAGRKSTTGYLQRKSPRNAVRSPIQGAVLVLRDTIIDLLGDRLMLWWFTFLFFTPWLLFWNPTYYAGCLGCMNWRKESFVNITRDRLRRHTNILNTLMVRLVPLSTYFESSIFVNGSGSSPLSEVFFHLQGFKIWVLWHTA